MRRLGVLALIVWSLWTLVWLSDWITWHTEWPWWSRSNGVWWLDEGLREQAWRSTHPEANEMNLSASVDELYRARIQWKRYMHRDSLTAWQGPR